MIVTTFAVGNTDYIARLNAVVAELNAMIAGNLSAGPATTNGLTLDYGLNANAIAIAVRNKDLANATVENPLFAIMRSASAVSAAFAMRTITAALSMTVSLGSTLGHGDNDTRWVYVYLIDNAGTIEVAVSSKYFGLQGIVSTTAEGGAGAADVASIMYSTTARASVAFLCIGRFKAPQTVAGTWATGWTNVEIWPFDVSNAGGTIDDTVIGGTTPAAGLFTELTASSTISAIGSGGVLSLKNGETEKAYITHASYSGGDGTRLHIATIGGSAPIRVVANSNGVELANGATSWSAVSDERSKVMGEFAPITDALNKLCTLRAGTGRFKWDAVDRRRVFLVAQDVQAVQPEAVDVDGDGMLAMRYTDVIPLLVAAMSQIKASFAGHEARIRALERA